VPNTNVESLYDYYLQQVAAESYLEQEQDWSGDRLLAQLRLGSNRKTSGNLINEGYPGYTRLTSEQAKEFQQKFAIVHQWSDNPDGARPNNDGIHNPTDLANTGLSATLIFDKVSGSYTLAIRSSEFQQAADGGDRERDIDGADIVLWHVFGTTHFPRVEDWPVMPVEYTGFTLVPFGFFDRNPALDLPAPTPRHCH